MIPNAERSVSGASDAPRSCTSLFSSHCGPARTNIATNHTIVHIADSRLFHRIIRAWLEIVEQRLACGY